MYKVSVPVINNQIKRAGRDKILKNLKDLDAGRVFVAIDRPPVDSEKRRKTFEELKDNCEYFKANGFEVGTWMWTFWCDGENDFQKFVGVSGKASVDFCCPTDKKFLEFVKENIREAARAGVDIIQFDDDFRYGVFDIGFGCLCDEHMNRICKELGEDVNREFMMEKILYGEPNKYRNAFLKTNGAVFEEFAREVRSAVNEVNPNIRISLCSCFTNWDIDGTTATRIAEALAGDTKPIMRLIGAPYWAVEKNCGNRLQDVVELERMEVSWNDNTDIEIMAEGDAYPRPRINCPSSYLEGFDTAIRAAGITDGILKYALDYTSSANYELGYVNAHQRNREIYKQIDKYFSNKKACGIRVYESMKKLADWDLPRDEKNIDNVQNAFFSVAARSLACMTIPTTYEGEGVCGIAFGENAKIVPEEVMEKGLIVDAAAARKLEKRGIDVGVVKWGDGIETPYEHFVEDDEYIATGNLTLKPIKVYNSEINPDAMILSVSENGSPMSYLYKNAKGYKFLVLNFETYFTSFDIMRHYARAKQYHQAIEWFGAKSPVKCIGNPDLYTICKEGDNSLSVGLWNFFADIVYAPEIELADTYKEVKFINCSGELKENKIILSDIPAFGFVGFELK